MVACSIPRPVCSVCLTVSLSCVARIQDGSCSGNVKEASGSDALPPPLMQSSNNLLLSSVRMSKILKLCPRHTAEEGCELKHQSPCQFHTPLTLTYEHNEQDLDIPEHLHFRQQLTPNQKGVFGTV